MATLDDLIAIDGVVMACEFSAEGNCKNYKSRMDMSPDMANTAGEHIATVTMLFKTLADSFTRASGMNWTPQKAWSYTGGDWTVVATNNRAVFVEATKADINTLSAMMQSKAEEVLHPSL